jgi:hypothetical protein
VNAVLDKVVDYIEQDREAVLGEYAIELL